MSEQNAIEPCVLFVGNISYSTMDTELTALFAEVAPAASVGVILDERERSRGFGFVRMESEEGAQQALTELHEKDIDGRPLRVSQARKDSRYLSMVDLGSN
jgi:RNA recognition motif-containing protein